MFREDILRERLRFQLKQARIANGLRQSDVAEALNKPQSYVAKIESGERRLEFVEALNYCDALGIDPITIIRLLLK